MRMWMVDVTKMCRQHLLGEHVECHMFVGTINKNKKLDGYVGNNLLQLKDLKKRHDALAKEMIRRNMKHNSELLPFDITKYDNYIQNSKVDIPHNIQVLKIRCKECKF